MSAYRRGLDPRITTFAATKYHGHRSVPVTLDKLIDDLHHTGQKTDSIRLSALTEAAKVVTREPAVTTDPTKVDPDFLCGEKSVRSSKGRVSMRVR